MLEYVYIGKIVNTHALKGELRIISNFEYKNKVFIKSHYLYIGESKSKLEINTYRVHKQYDMVTFVGIDNINDAVIYKGKKVFCLKTDLNLNEEEILSNDLIGMEVIFNSKVLGIINDYRSDNGNKIIRVNDLYLPYNKDFIEKMDIKSRKVYYKNIDYLL